MRYTATGDKWTLQNAVQGNVTYLGNYQGTAITDTYISSAAA